MKKKYRLTLLVTTLLTFHGCTTLVDATTKAPIQPDPRERTFGTYIDDQRLEVIVGVNINKAHPDLKRAHINVTSFNGAVLLSGQVPNQELRDLAAVTASDITKVRQVYNELEIKGNTSLLSRTGDGWLATKVKTVLLADKQVTGGRIKVVVENGTVYLMGLITKAEAGRAANLASNVGGVQEVVRVFEYID